MNYKVLPAVKPEAHSDTKLLHFCDKSRLDDKKASFFRLIIMHF